MKISSLLKTNRIITALKAKTKEEVLEELVDVLVKEGIIKDKKEAVQRLLKREEIVTTGIGYGIAMPHAKINEIKDVVAVLGKSKEGVDFKALDKKLVHLFFLLLSNEEQTSLQIRILAKISKLLKQEFIRETLKKLDRAEEIIEFIRKYEE